MKYLIITMLFALHISAQDFNKDVITLSNKNQILKFVPKGYEILGTVRGNLNNDNYDDYILVLKKNDEENISNFNDYKPEKRPLLILIGNSNNKLELRARENWFLHRVGTEYFKLSSGENSNEEAVVKTGETILTKKEFGVIPFGKFDIYDKLFY